MSDTKPPCCVVSERLGPRRLLAINAELSEINHRAFRKLALAYDLPKHAIEHHKHRCMRIAAPYVLPPSPAPRGLSPIRLPGDDSAPSTSRSGREPASSDSVQGVDSEPRSSGRETMSSDDGKPESSERGGATRSERSKPSEPQAERERELRKKESLFSLPQEIAEQTRARGLAKGSTPLIERMAYIVAQMSAGDWDSARDVPLCAAMWGLSEGTVRLTVKHVVDGRKLNRGDDVQRSEEALAFYAWQLQQLKLALADCEAPGEHAAIHARMAEVRGKMDGIAGIQPTRGAAVAVNVYSSAQFIEAQNKIVDTFQCALDLDAVAMLVPDLDRETVERVLAASRSLADMRMAAMASPMLEASTD